MTIYTEAMLNDKEMQVGEESMDYELGLEQLRQHLRSTALEEEYLVYEARLRENLHKEKLFGPNEHQRSERAQLVYQLNHLAQQVNVSFNDLCLRDNISNYQPASSPNYVIGKDTHVDNVFTYTGHTKEVRAVAWTHNGSIIASAANDNTVQLWQPFTGELRIVYREHTDNVTTLAWSPDGKRIASAGMDKTVRIWQTV